MTTKEKFIEMAKNITRPGIDEMMAWLETTDFYVAPASTKFHGAQAGGLCAHSITVAKRLVEVANLYAPGKYSMDVLMTVSLFHDVCKVSTYSVDMRNSKNSAGKWEQFRFIDSHQRRAWAATITVLFPASVLWSMASASHRRNSAL